MIDPQAALDKAKQLANQVALQAKEAKRFEELKKATSQELVDYVKGLPFDIGKTIKATGGSVTIKTVTKIPTAASDPNLRAMELKVQGLENEAKTANADKIAELTAKMAELSLEIETLSTTPLAVQVRKQIQQYKEANSYTANEVSVKLS